MTRRAIATAILTAAAVVTLTGCSVGAITDAIEGKQDVFSIEVGDCFNDDTATSEEVVESVKMPECTEEHDNEAFHIYDVSDEDFPSFDEAALQAAADEGCYAEFEEFIGTGIEGTSLDYGYYYPSTESWEQGDREILCLAYDLDGPVSEPLKGKGAEYPYEG